MTLDVSFKNSSISTVSRGSSFEFMNSRILLLILSSFLRMSDKKDLLVYKSIDTYIKSDIYDVIHHVSQTNTNDDTNKYINVSIKTFIDN